MDDTPIVSVIIPTYGGSDSLRRSINSVLHQNYSNLEVIVVDDNNPDTDSREKTELLMREFSNDKRLKYIKHTKNRNASAARNTGFRNSIGAYICLLDDDDIFLPEKVKKQVDYLNSNPEYGACYCWRRQGNKEICGTYTGDLSQQLLDQSFTPTTCSLMIRRSCYDALGGFDESYFRHQDYEFLLRFFKQFKIGVVETVLLEIHGNEIYNQLRGKRLYDMKARFFLQFEKDIKRIDTSNPGFLRRVYASHYSSTCKELIRYGNILLAMKAYVRYGVKGGWLFWEYLFRIVYSWMKRKIKKE